MLKSACTKWTASISDGHGAAGIRLPGTVTIKSCGAWRGSMFLDTNLFEKDPFSKNNYARALRDAAAEGLISLYFYRVVYEELKYHTIKIYEKANKELLL